MDTVDVAIVMPGSELVGRSVDRIIRSCSWPLGALTTRLHDDWPTPPTEIGSPDVVLIDVNEAAGQWGERVAARWLDVVAQAGPQIIVLAEDPIPWDVGEVMDTHGLRPVHRRLDAPRLRELIAEQVLAPRGLLLLNRWSPAEA